MSGYIYSDRQIQTYTEHAQAAVLWERAQHFERNANYWKHRAQSAERRMQEHNCQEDS
ncbi:hypothetical protein [Glutamicibacter arilaitensis]|uniref:hypothetical protein n=1 Tax=Glutamicibacter arilaitensis TaxID=256701 RepID=UPI003FD05143